MTALPTSFQMLGNSPKLLPPYLFVLRTGAGILEETKLNFVYNVEKIFTLVLLSVGAAL